MPLRKREKIQKMLRKDKLIPFAAALLSAALLSLAYPPFCGSDAAFFALVPLIAFLRRVSPRCGFWMGFAFGFLFRAISLFWLCSLKDNGGPPILVYLGLAALGAYCALYSGLFAFAVSSLWMVQRRESFPCKMLFRFGAWICEPLLWVGSEYLLANAFTGFPWNPLAATQYRNLPILAISSIAGSAGLSALIAAVNSSVASLLVRIFESCILPRFSMEKAPAYGRRIPRSLALFLTLSLLVAAWYRGIDYVRNIDRESARSPSARVALVHPDAPCIFLKDDKSIEETNARLLDYTSIAALGAPDFILWPETSLPGALPGSAESANLVREAYKLSGVPLLAGGIEYRPRFEGDMDGLVYNSLFFFEEGRRIASIYRKQHLVPFGEYIPLESRIPALKRLAPTGYSCEAGFGPVIMEISPKNGKSGETIKLSPLICFEDAFPYLSRNAARAGANAIVSVVNDAWFDGTYLAEQHLAQAVLRAVETGLPVMRATNKGVSAVILPNGRILRRLGDGKGSGEAGFLLHDMPFSATPKQTPYVKHGDAIFSAPCAGLLLGIAMAGLAIKAYLKQKRRMLGFA